MRSNFAMRFAVQFVSYSLAIVWMALGSGAVGAYAQTPAASVCGVLTRVSRGGPLASAAVQRAFSGLKLQGAVQANHPAASTSQVQMSWGGASAPASRNLAFQVADQDAKNQAKEPAQPARVASADDAQVFELMYENFRRTYRLGPTDEIAIRVRLEPDYSIERAKISPDGRVFHPLLGDVLAGGLTVEQLTKRLTQDLLRYIKQPEVSVQLLEARSAKIGVLGEVARPGIFVMGEPMTVLDAITQAGGFVRTGSRSNVALVRQGRNGRYQTLTVNVKKLLEGKADAEENLPLQPGDTVIVHGNFLKKLEYVTALSGFGQFLTFLAITR
jgi:polysaccharide biosynthesis/export protein